MRHQCAHRKLGRSSSHRRALMRNLVTSFFRHERFETSVQKAKDLRPVAEKLITLACNGTLAAKRSVYSYLLDKDVVHKLFVEIAPRVKGRKGGYTRVVRSGTRHGDAAEMAIIELVDRQTTVAGTTAGGETKAA